MQVAELLSEFLPIPNPVSTYVRDETRLHCKDDPLEQTPCRQKPDSQHYLIFRSCIASTLLLPLDSPSAPLHQNLA